MNINTETSNNDKFCVEYETPSVFKKDPEINVISKEDFEERVEKVFYLLWKTLSKSFGPYGAPTLIYNYPFSHVTKDGYTIMKNLSMNAADTKIDEAIKRMAADICGRLNYSVGDGTTTAIIATQSIYSNYRKLRDDLSNQFILPRDIIYKYNDIKENIINRLSEKAIPIRVDTPEHLKEDIAKVVYISSNGDETFTEYISDLYKELMAPSITCRLAPDGITKKLLVNGYKYDLILNDRLYINNDDNTMSLEDADVIIFGTKITASTYECILKPLNQESRIRGRNLIVVAPSYDDNALQQTISVDLNNEYKKSHKINMVLTTYRAISGHTRKLINDFAILMNTTVIDRALEERIKSAVSTGVPIDTLISIDHRNIDGLRCAAINTETNQGVLFSKNVDTLPDGYEAIYNTRELVDDYIDLGYIKKCELGLKESYFTELIYDQKKYDAVLQEATIDLKEKEEKYKKMGTFNVEVSQAQERLYALRLKMGIIEVGADSELSQALIKDAVDDAVRAAASAYKYGLVYGCNLNLIQSIKAALDETSDPVEKTLIRILMDGFIDVYRTVINNAFNDIKFEVSDNIDEESKKIEEWVENKLTHGNTLFDDFDTLKEVVSELIYPMNTSISFTDILIQYSIKVNKVFDISKFKYTDDVINSLQTDEEILKAVIDLISLLIVGNQMVVTQKDY